MKEKVSKFLWISFLLLGCSNPQYKNESKHTNVTLRENPAANNALFLACKNGDLDAVRRSVADGANVNATDKDGATPLHWAVDQGSKDIVEYLVEHGADATTEDISGMTPISIAVSGGHWEILEWFVGECTTIDWSKMVWKDYNFHERFQRCQPAKYNEFSDFLNGRGINIYEFLQQTDVTIQHPES